MSALEHVVLFKLKADAPETKKTDLMKSLVALQGVIPGILYASAGVNFSARAQGYTHGFVARFKDRTALDHYISHPAHVAVVEQKVKPISEGVLALDYEILS
ncbi:MAG: Dabb family protein [Elusimicrobia bacterium]|nr:Dabb family protein [Elusimicrobiota bacterium]